MITIFAHPESHFSDLDAITLYLTLLHLPVIATKVNFIKIQVRLQQGFKFWGPFFFFLEISVLHIKTQDMLLDPIKVALPRQGNIYGILQHICFFAEK